MNPKTNTILSYTLAILIGVVVYQLLSQSIFKTPSFESQLVGMANEVNKNCPLMMDRDTRLDNTAGGPGKNFTSNYTLINSEAVQLNIVQMKQEMIPQKINYVKTSEDLQIFRREKVTLRYNYRDKSGVFLFSITIGPADYAR